jgi:hypothetical protein
LAAAILVLAQLASASAQQRLADFRRVVVDMKANAVQRAAAEELAQYAGRIVGRTLEVVSCEEYANSHEGPSFFVGAAAERALSLRLAPWQQEEWLLRTVPQGFVLAGDDGDGDPWSHLTRAGSMLAVYTLLDDYLGVHWFWPGPFGEHVPQDPQAVVPALDLRAAPKFSIRSVSLGYSMYHTKALREAARKWQRRSRLAWTRSAVFGHSWSDTFGLSKGKAVKAEPEWFALVNGKRHGPQMCTTHPEVIRRVVERVLKGKTVIVNISPSDGGGFCQCDEQTKSETHKRLGIPSCTSLDVPGVLAYDGKSPQLSDRIFTYANEVARRVREQNSDKSVGIHAYTYYNRPPLRIEKLEPNIYISFVYQAAAHRDPAALTQWRESVSGWKRLGAKLVVREGWGNHYNLNLPWLHHQQIMANLAEAYRLGFIAAYGEGSKCFATQAPNYWALTRMLWDPEHDTSKLMDEFFQSAYGPVAAEMRAFFETYEHALDRNWQRRRRTGGDSGIGYVNLINSWHILLPAETVAEAEGHLAAAEKQAPPGEYVQRVAFHRFGQDYTQTMLELLDHYRQLAELGLKLEAFSIAVETPRQDDVLRERLLRAAYRLGERREDLLLAHRDWAAMDEGLYAFTNDRHLRQWHAAVKKALGISQPTRLTKETLAEK